MTDEKDSGTGIGPVPGGAPEHESRSFPSGDEPVAPYAAPGVQEEPGPREDETRSDRHRAAGQEEDA